MNFLNFLLNFLKDWIPFHNKHMKRIFHLFEFFDFILNLLKIWMSVNNKRKFWGWSKMDISTELEWKSLYGIADNIQNCYKTNSIYIFPLMNSWILPCKHFANTTIFIWSYCWYFTSWMSEKLIASFWNKLAKCPATWNLQSFTTSTLKGHIYKKQY